MLGQHLSEEATGNEFATIVGSRQVKSVETHDEGSGTEVGRDYLELGPVRTNL